MKLIDITREITPEMAIYPNNPEVSFEQTQEADRENGKNALSKITLGTHTGTHIDSPRHMYPGGAGTESYALEQMNGECEVVDTSNLASVITAEDIPETDKDIVLFKTKNSLGDVSKFDDDFVALDDSAAEELVKRGVKLVGLDALSIRKRGTQNQVHETLIDAGIIILEGLWLADVTAGEYELMCLPIKWDSDGAPVRAVLK